MLGFDSEKAGMDKDEPQPAFPSTPVDGPEISVEESSAYEAKARILNDAIQEVGMGRYQWGLFVVTGFGYFADNIWPIVTGLILPAVVNEFHFNPPFLKLGQNIGLLVGAVFWGIGADIWGRRYDLEHSSAHSNLGDTFPVC